MRPVWGGKLILGAGSGSWGTVAKCEESAEPNVIERCLLCRTSIVTPLLLSASAGGDASCW